MICNPTIDQKMLSVKLIVKANKNNKIQQKQNACTIDLKTLSKYNITTNGTIPGLKSYSFRNTGKWSGEAIMGQRASNKYGSFDNGIQFQLPDDYARC